MSLDEPPQSCCCSSVAAVAIPLCTMCLVASVQGGGKERETVSHTPSCSKTLVNSPSQKPREPFVGALDWCWIAPFAWHRPIVYQVNSSGAYEHPAGEKTASSSDLAPSCSIEKRDSAEMALLARLSTRAIRFVMRRKRCGVEVSKSRAVESASWEIVSAVLVISHAETQRGPCSIDGRRGTLGKLLESKEWRRERCMWLNSYVISKRAIQP